jgi:hypothetical protein
VALADTACAFTAHAEATLVKEVTSGGLADASIRTTTDPFGGKLPKETSKPPLVSMALPAEEETAVGVIHGGKSESRTRTPFAWRIPTFCNSIVYSTELSWFADTTAGATAFVIWSSAPGAKGQLSQSLLKLFELALVTNQNEAWFGSIPTASRHPEPELLLPVLDVTRSSPQRMGNAQSTNASLPPPRVVPALTSRAYLLAGSDAMRTSAGSLKIGSNSIRLPWVFCQSSTLSCLPFKEISH